jgi:hypothetical protein
MRTAGSGGGAVSPTILIAPVVALLGCSSGELPRLPRSQAEMISAREAANQLQAAESREVVARNVARIKAEYDAYVAGHAPGPPIVDILVISGGGDWGAFGAGVLKGWGGFLQERSRARISTPSQASARAP